MKIIAEDTRKHIVRLKYSDNMHGYWLYLNGSLVEHIDDIDRAVNEFISLSNKWNGNGLYFMIDSYDGFSGEMFDISDYNLGIYPYRTVRNRMSVGSLAIIALYKVV